MCCKRCAKDFEHAIQATLWQNLFFPVYAKCHTKSMLLVIVFFFSLSSTRLRILILCRSISMDALYQWNEMQWLTKLNFTQIHLCHFTSIYKPFYESHTCICIMHKSLLKLTESSAVHYVRKPNELCTCFIMCFKCFFAELRYSDTKCIDYCKHFAWSSKSNENRSSSSSVSTGRFQLYNKFIPSTIWNRVAKYAHFVCLFYVLKSSNVPHYFEFRMDGELVTVVYDNNMLRMYDTCHLYIYMSDGFWFDTSIWRKKEKKPTPIIIHPIYIWNARCAQSNTKKTVVDDTVKMMSVDELSQEWQQKKSLRLFLLINLIMAHLITELSIETVWTNK